MSKNSNSIYQREKRFINHAKEIHGDRYDYSTVKYVNNRTKVIIKCREHGEFTQLPNNHLKSQNCPTCYKNNIVPHNKRTLENFIRDAIRIHDLTYNYSESVYVNNRTPIKVICSIHGEFYPTPDAHVRLKTKCPQCVNITTANKQRFKYHEYVEKVNNIHDNKFIYPAIEHEYKNVYSKISIICPVHGLFLKSAHGHLYNEIGCPTCSNTPFSRVAILWLESIMEKQNIFIQHALNGGEFKIPNTNYKADGFCKETKTIYEFYGDKFHGNLSRFNFNDKCQPFDDTVTAGELYQKTIIREDIIKELGYNMITIWEQDFNNK